MPFGFPDDKPSPTPYVDSEVTAELEQLLGRDTISRLNKIQEGFRNPDSRRHQYLQQGDEIIRQKLGYISRQHLSEIDPATGAFAQGYIQNCMLGAWYGASNHQYCSLNYKEDPNVSNVEAHLEYGLGSLRKAQEQIGVLLTALESDQYGRYQHEQTELRGLRDAIQGNPRIAGDKGLIGKFESALEQARGQGGPAIS